MSKPDILFIMTDQQRFDTIAALGNSDIYTPNLDRLVRRGISCTNAYTTCPVCLPARYIIRTGCEAPTTSTFSNSGFTPEPGQPETAEERCGPYLARRMSQLGYRTFGIGKFHSSPWNEDLGYELQLHSEELYNKEQRNNECCGDAYARWIAEEHPEFNFLEGLMGERTEMYYIPQTSHMPAEITVEHWAAERAIEQIRKKDGRPYFGLVSFVGPHPPCAPPVPFNRIYSPDRMSNPFRGDIRIDHMDQYIPEMNYRIWAEDINDPWARILKAHYYGEITYIDWCLGKILDAVEKSGRADNTLICFFTDHGDHLGDHHAWQKESFFEQSCHIPFLVSWPEKLPAGERCAELVSLADLFGVATTAAGDSETREGIDLLGMFDGSSPGREYLRAYYGTPGTDYFKIMIRHENWKYIYMANGAQEQLFDLDEDPRELRNMTSVYPDVKKKLRELAVSSCDVPGCRRALEDGDLKSFPFRLFDPSLDPSRDQKLRRIHQFDGSRGIKGFPDNPEDIMDFFKKD